MVLGVDGVDVVACVALCFHDVVNRHVEENARALVGCRFDHSISRHLIGDLRAVLDVLFQTWNSSFLRDRPRGGQPLSPS